MNAKHTIALLAVLLTSQIIISQNYIIDASHSAVQIQVERFGVVDVIGRFKDVSGEITFTADDIYKTSANAIIKVASYDANNVGGEEAVKSKAFLDAETYPEITFESIKTIVKEDKSYLVGNLTIHGVTNEIELPFSLKGPLLDLPTQKQSVAFNASIIVNRQDYGISFDRKLPDGTSIVGNDVEIKIIALAIAE